MPAPTTTTRLLRAMRSHGAAALAGFAIGAALFGMDDFERFGMWAQDKASALAEPPSLVADEDDGARPGKPSATSASLAKVEKSGHASPLLQKPFAEDPLASGSLADADPQQWSIPYWIDPAGLPPQIPKARAIALIAKAAASWGACGARFSYQGERAKPSYGSYGPGEEPTTYLPVIGWMTLPDKVSGLTFTSADSLTGQVERWTMDLDPASTASASDMLATATHEFGHVLGLNHARDARSIMFGGPNPKVLRPTSLDLAECQRVVSTWSAAAAEDMAAPLGEAIAETLSGAGHAAALSVSASLAQAQAPTPQRR